MVLHSVLLYLYLAAVCLGLPTRVRWDMLFSQSDSDDPTVEKVSIWPLDKIKENFNVDSTVFSEHRSRENEVIPDQILSTERRSQDGENVLVFELDKVRETTLGWLSTNSFTIDEKDRSDKLIIAKEKFEVFTPLQDVEKDGECNDYEPSTTFNYDQMDKEDNEGEIMMERPEERSGVEAVIDSLIPKKMEENDDVIVFGVEGDKVLTPFGWQEVAKHNHSDQEQTLSVNNSLIANKEGSETGRIKGGVEEIPSGITESEPKEQTPQNIDKDEMIVFEVEGDKVLTPFGWQEINHSHSNQNQPPPSSSNAYNYTVINKKEEEETDDVIVFEVEGNKVLTPFGWQEAGKHDHSNKEQLPIIDKRGEADKIESAAEDSDRILFIEPKLNCCYYGPSENMPSTSTEAIAMSRLKGKENIFQAREKPQSGSHDEETVISFKELFNILSKKDLEMKTVPDEMSNTSTRVYEDAIVFGP